MSVVAINKREPNITRQTDGLSIWIGVSDVLKVIIRAGMISRTVKAWCGGDISSSYLGPVFSETDDVVHE